MTAQNVLLLVEDPEASGRGGRKLKAINN